MKHFFKYINRFEKLYLSREVRKSTWYFFVKLIILSPFVLLGLIERGVKSIFHGKIERADKPPIVFSNIVSGFANLAFPDEQVESLAMKRARICSECPSAQKTGVYSVVVDNRTKDIQGMKCADCGCNLSAKVRSVSDSCPQGKW